MTGALVWAGKCGGDQVSVLVLILVGRILRPYNGTRRALDDLPVPKSLAMSWRQLAMPWEGVYRVSISPCQCARGAPWFQPARYAQKPVSYSAVQTPDPRRQKPAAMSPCSDTTGATVCCPHPDTDSLPAKSRVHQPARAASGSRDQRGAPRSRPGSAPGACLGEVPIGGRDRCKPHPPRTAPDY